MYYSIPPRNNTGKDDMAYWEGFLLKDEINLLLSQPEWMNLDNAYIGGSSGQGNIDPNYRSTKVGWLGTKPELIPIWDKLSRAVAEINRKFFHYDLTGFYEPMQLSVYFSGENGHYDWHTDASVKDNEVPRKLSMAMLLSDPSEFEGGEFQVKIDSDKTQTLECKKGRAWFFPSYTLHRITPVTKGMRRSLVLWVGGPPFR